MKNIQNIKKQKSYYHQHKKTKYNNLRFLSLSFFVFIFANCLWFLKPQITEYSKNWINGFNKAKVAKVTPPQIAAIAPPIQAPAPTISAPIAIDTIANVATVTINSPLINQKPEHQTQPILTVAVKLETLKMEVEEKQESATFIPADSIAKAENAPKINPFAALSKQYAAKKGKSGNENDLSEYTHLLENIALFPKNKKLMYQELDAILTKKDHAFFKEAGELKGKLYRLAR
jgi:hypothetical protein